MHDTNEASCDMLWYVRYDVCSASSDLLCFFCNWMSDILCAMQFLAWFKYVSPVSAYIIAWLLRQIQSHGRLVQIGMVVWPRGSVYRWSLISDPPLSGGSGEILHRYNCASAVAPWPCSNSISCPISCCQFGGFQWMMNWRRCGKKLSWPILKYCDITLKEWEKPQVSVKAGLRTENRTRDFTMRSRSTGLNIQIIVEADAVCCSRIWRTWLGFESLCAHRRGRVFCVRTFFAFRISVQGL
jgi:hypothetical protein